MRAVLVLMLLLVACGPQRHVGSNGWLVEPAPLTVAERSALTAMIGRNLRDPESASYEIPAMQPGTRYLCGTVNARNGFGGYTGPRLFVALAGPIKAGAIEWFDLALPASDEDVARWAETCRDHGYLALN